MWRAKEKTKLEEDFVWVARAVMVLVTETGI